MSSRYKLLATSILLLVLAVGIESRARLGRNPKNHKSALDASNYYSDLQKLDDAVKNEVLYEIQQGIPITPENLAEAVKENEGVKSWWQRLSDYLQTHFIVDSIKRSLRKGFDEEVVPAVQKAMNGYIIPTIRKQLEKDA